MSFRRISAVVAVFAISSIAVTGCVPESSETEQNQDNAVANDDNGDNDNGQNNDNGDNGDNDNGQDDDNDNGQNDDNGDNDNDNDQNDDNVPEPWDCAPDFELDDQRYTELEDASSLDLINGLQDKTSGHNGQGYDAARDFMFETLEVRDDGKLECVYTYDRVEPDGSNLPGGQFNTEHTWPQSRGADVEPQRSDVHHLFPVDMDANNRRANYEYGDVDCDESTCEWHRDGSFLGPSADDNRDPVFEVRPERRGDIARAILYYSIRYSEPLSAGEEETLRQWNCQDPPDDYELSRNDDIEDFQDNRNPFIDRPDFVDRISQF